MEYRNQANISSQVHYRMQEEEYGLDHSVSHAYYGKVCRIARDAVRRGSAGGNQQRLVGATLPIEALHSQR